MNVLTGATVRIVVTVRTVARVKIGVTAPTVAPGPTVMTAAPAQHAFDLRTV